MRVLEEPGSCWQAGRQLTLATMAWASWEDKLLGDKLEGALGRGQTGQPPSFLTLPLGLSRVAGSSEDG